VDLNKKGSLAAKLYRELAGSRIKTSHLFPDFAFDHILDEVTHCQVIKDSAKRQVFYLKTPRGEFFLKRSNLVRTKDRVRHFILPRRRWAEWRNLHRLRAAQIEAAAPVLKGEGTFFSTKFFFLLTRRVGGTHFECDSELVARKLGQYVALLHSRGVYHADLHPKNLIVSNEGQISLIDVQEVYFLFRMPRRLRLHNMGKLFFNLRSQTLLENWIKTFLEAYNQTEKRPITTLELFKSSDRHQKKYYRSRTKRCCKNSTEFVVIKEYNCEGYKRRDFPWGSRELSHALRNAEPIKDGRVYAFQRVCIKVCAKQLFHKDRCIASWKMSRALEVRGIPTPRALAYFIMDGKSFFLSELLFDSTPLNNYLSGLTLEKEKRQAFKKLALQLKKIHDHNIWQRDFKSSNVLCRNGEFFLIDLDGVKILRQLPRNKKIVNLAQLNASVSNAITIKDRLRFFYYYTAGKILSRQERRDIYRKVWEITAKKNTAIYDLDITTLRNINR
jgi:tRNA A-37 threonylcarbamoyl transferase component Bud32